MNAGKRYGMADAGKALGFVNPEKGPKHYIRRYLNESEYRDWFHRNYPDYTIYRGIGISEDEFRSIVDELTIQDTSGQGADMPKEGPGKQDSQRHAAQDDTGSQDTSDQDSLTRLKELAERIKQEEDTESLTVGNAEEARPRGEDLARTVFDSYSDESTSYDRRTFEEFVDERILVSRDLFGKKEMKIKILEVSDEIQESKIRWKFGDRVKVNKILITIKHLDSMKVEEGEFDIEAIEKELAEKRHYSSTNRWIPAADIKNGYIVNSKHTALISDAVALDYIIF